MSNVECRMENEEGRPGFKFACLEMPRAPSLLRPPR